MLTHADVCWRMRQVKTHAQKYFLKLARQSLEGGSRVRLLEILVYVHSTSVAALLQLCCITSAPACASNLWWVAASTSVAALLQLCCITSTLLARQISGEWQPGRNFVFWGRGYRSISFSGHIYRGFFFCSSVAALLQLSLVVAEALKLCCSSVAATSVSVSFLGHIYRGIFVGNTCRKLCGHRHDRI
jgi:hypothetical protein